MLSVWFTPGSVVDFSLSYTAGCGVAIATYGTEPAAAAGQAQPHAGEHSQAQATASGPSASLMQSKQTSSGTLFGELLLALCQ